MGRADKIPLHHERAVTFEGLFDPKETYYALRDYMEGTKHYDMSEMDILEKNTGANKEITTFWECALEFTDYYKIIIAYRLEMVGKGVEVKMDGKTKKVVEGKARIIINSYAEPDFLGKRTQTPLMNFATKIYDKYFGKEEISRCIEATAKDVNDLVALFRQQMNMDMKR